VITGKTSLRAVKSDEAPPAPPRPKSVAQAAATGSYRDLLVAMRERIARTVSSPDCPPRDLASLTRRLNDIAKEIDALDLRAKQEAAEGGSGNADETWDSSAI
jgi:hypothetical protein